jgi:hypothetical protein
MDRESNDPTPEPLPTDIERPPRSCERAGWAGACAFVIVLALMWAYHPLLMKRHPDRVIGQCAGAALVTFAAIWFVDSQKKPGS